jgi:GNAT superfamily N-acetyltransferase
MHEEFVWYALDLDRVEPIPLREGYRLHLVTEAEAVEILRDVPAVPPEEGRRRIADGVQFWAVLKGQEPAFACFVFSGPFPLEAARGGWYELPDGVACLENGYTNRKFRGRLIAPAAWTAIAERLREDGFTVLTTKVEAENTASRRTVEKTGFRAATVMGRRRRGLRTRVSFDNRAEELTAPEREFAEHLRGAVSR